QYFSETRLLILVIACLVGLIPESGPHLIFVTMFARGLAPFSVLLASSIVQDGHGMLPLLAHSRRDFIRVKLINFGFGLLIGLIGLWLGF
ncbi:MAG: putative manganese transporter, partial [Candidatus Marinimicrobia bacterium]|nr:putative manganese transporter [Candidatus Neomarinimicrobiota bacterium]